MDAGQPDPNPNPVAVEVGRARTAWTTTELGRMTRAAMSIHKRTDPHAPTTNAGFDAHYLYLRKKALGIDIAEKTVPAREVTGHVLKPRETHAEEGVHMPLGATRSADAVYEPHSFLNPELVEAYQPDEDAHDTAYAAIPLNDLHLFDIPPDFKDGYVGEGNKQGLKAYHMLGHVEVQNGNGKAILRDETLMAYGERSCPNCARPSEPSCRLFLLAWPQAYRIHIIACDSCLEQGCGACTYDAQSTRSTACTKCRIKKSGTACSNRIKSKATLQKETLEQLFGFAKGSAQSEAQLNEAKALESIYKRPRPQT